MTETCSRARCPNKAHPSACGMCMKHYRAHLKANPTVPADIVVEHLRVLREEHGYGFIRLAELTGVGRATLRDIARGDRSYVFSRTATAILGLHPGLTNPPAHMDPTGAVRRVRALVAVGFTQERIAIEIGGGQCNLWKYLTGTAAWVTPEKFARIDAAFRNLGQLPAPTGPSALRARRRAARRGWLPPMAWDDHTIDDPAAQPDVTVLRPAKPKSVLQDFETEYLELRDYVRLSDVLIAERLGITYDTLITRLSRLGIPSQRSDRRAS